MVESKHQWKAWLYLAPAIVLLLVFTVWPIINTVRLAFLNDYNSLSEVGGATFTVGIKNFQTVIGDSGFKTALKNTMLLCLFTVPISTILALLIAELHQAPAKGTANHLLPALCDQLHRHRHGFRRDVQYHRYAAHGAPDSDQGHCQ